MRKCLVGICVALQLLILANMVFGRESIVRSGERVYLRTAPLDPRDPFRGDFVRLRYPMNDGRSVPLKWSNPDYQSENGGKVYAVLSDVPGSVHQVEYLTDAKPTSELYLRGRVKLSRFLRHNSEHSKVPRNIKYGIEQLFVEQGAGKEIEEKQGRRGGLQVPMEIEVEC